MPQTSDVKLRPGQVVVEAWDLVIDSPDRRANTTPQRRALVHDFDDGLTINWAKDYPGGVTVPGALKVDKARAGSIDLDGALTVVLLLNLKTGELTVPSETTTDTRSAALSEARRVREHIDAGRITLPRGGASSVGTGEVLTHTEAMAVVESSHFDGVEDVLLPIDIIKMVIDLAKDNRDLRDRVKKLEGQ